MNLYKIEQDVKNEYNTYSDAVVCCETEDEAKNFKLGDTDSYGSWVRPEYVKVIYLGIADSSIKPGLICASYHAG